MVAYMETGAKTETLSSDKLNLSEDEKQPLTLVSPVPVAAPKKSKFPFFLGGSLLAGLAVAIMPWQKVFDVLVQTISKLSLSFMWAFDQHTALASGVMVALLGCLISLGIHITQKSPRWIEAFIVGGVFLVLTSGFVLSYTKFVQKDRMEDVKSEMGYNHYIEARDFPDNMDQLDFHRTQINGPKVCEAQQLAWMQNEHAAFVLTINGQPGNKTTCSAVYNKMEWTPRGVWG